LKWATFAVIGRLTHPTAYAAAARTNSNKIMGFPPFFSLEAYHNQLPDLPHSET